MEPKVSTCIWIPKGAREAVEFWVSLLPDSRIDRVTTFEQKLGDTSHQVGVIEFTLAGTPYQVLEAGPHHEFNDAMSIVVTTEDQAETDRLWDRLTADGGKPVACGWLNDRWGVRWQIVPRGIRRMFVSPDRAAAQRAMDALMTMQKIDIATIERAFAG